jgi:hypothetical protein
MLLVLILTGTASARPDARKMTCQQAQLMVQQQGAVVMTTGRYTYQRFVAHRGYCDYWETIRTARTATRDNPRCRIGYICEPRMDDDNGFRPFRWRHRR